MGELGKMNETHDVSYLITTVENGAECYYRVSGYKHIEGGISFVESADQTVEVPYDRVLSVMEQTTMSVDITEKVLENKDVLVTK